MWCVTIIGVSSWYTVNICCTKTASKAYIVSSYAFEFVYMLLKVVRHYHGSIKAVSCEYQGSIKGT